MKLGVFFGVCPSSNCLYMLEISVSVWIWILRCIFFVSTYSRTSLFFQSFRIPNSHKMWKQTSPKSFEPETGLYRLPNAKFFELDRILRELEVFCAYPTLNVSGAGPVFMCQRLWVPEVRAQQGQWEQCLYVLPEVIGEWNILNEPELVSLPWKVCATLHFSLENRFSK